MSYWDSNNLLNSRNNEQFGENSILFTIENFHLGEEVSKEIDAAIEKMTIRQGLYMQNVNNYGYMSHDNLTALMSYLPANVRKEIWEEIKRQWFRYDNVNPDSPSWSRILHPRDIIYYGILGGSALAWLGFPLYLLMMLITVFTDCENNEFGSPIFSTSGKLLLWVRYKGMQNNALFSLTFKALSYIMKKSSMLPSWYDVFKFYFNQDNNHPNVILAKEQFENKN